ncbi:MAG TPA: T9SS type A sorting domain-containing protein [Candidatus Kapabacteria bacterium]|nr:T9SS type A sorting domain-containing protein [Candidatus Kapabacteria bacterium]
MKTTIIILVFLSIISFSYSRPNIIIENKGQLCFENSAEVLYYCYDVNQVIYFKKTIIIIEKLKLEQDNQKTIDSISLINSEKVEVKGLCNYYENFYLPHCSNGIINVRHYNEIIYKDKNNKILYSFNKHNENNRLNDYKNNFDKLQNDDSIEIELDWSTFIGGNDDDKIMSLDKDKKLNILVTGFTFSTNFPIYGNNSKYYGATDLFVSKFNRNGEIIWSTYIGGSNTERTMSSVCDSQCSYWICGETYSKDYPTTSNAFQKTLNYDQGAILTKLDTSGYINYSTFFAGEAYDCFADIAFDYNNSLWLTGRTASSYFPVTNDAKRKVKKNQYETFLVNFNLNGNLLYSSYWGSNDNSNNILDLGDAIICDKEGNIILTGYSNSTRLDVSNNAYQKINRGGFDSFIAKFDSNANLIWSTYLGGYLNDYASNMCFDSENNIIIQHYTLSSELEVKNSVLNKTFSGGIDNYISKFDKNGNFIWSTYFGGTKWDGWDFGCFVKIGGGISTFSNDDIIFYFTTQSNDLKTKTPFINKFCGGSEDSYICLLSKDGELKNSSYFGGFQNEWASDLVVIDDNSFAIAGKTNSYNLPVKTSFQSSTAGKDDGFISVFQFKEIQKDINAPYVQSTNDSCGILKEIIVEDTGAITSGIDSWSIEYNQNCNVAFERISQNVVKFTVSLIYFSEKGFFTIWVFDKEKNMKVVEGELNPSQGTPIRFIPETKFEMPKPSYAFQLIKDKIGIFNFSDSEIIIDNLFLSINTNFSIPQTQFPLIIPAKQTIPLEVCFYEDKYFSNNLIYYDTITYIDKCGFVSLPISIELEPTVFTGNSNCNVPIYFGTNIEQKIEATISPQPATEEMHILFNQAIKDDIDFYIYSVIGNLIETKSIKLNNEGNLKLQLINYESGIYFLVIKSNNLLIKKKLLIVK